MLAIYNGTNGVFDIQAKAIRALEAIDAARRGTVPDEVSEFLKGYKALNGALDLEAAIDGIAAGVDGWRSSQQGFISQVQSALQAHLVAACEAERQALDPSDLTGCLQFLVAEMIRQGYYVTGNNVGFTLARDGSGVGDVGVCYTARRGDGKLEENILTEPIELELVDSGSLSVEGTLSADPLTSYWPRGSGAQLVLVPIDETNAINANGTFEAETISGIPDGWIINVGTIGQTVKLTQPARQTVAISGTPTDGTYILRYTDGDGRTYATTAIPYDATANQVQTALRALPGLGQVTVASTGTSPDLTHEVVFVGVAGLVQQLTSVNHLNTGSITHATIVPGDMGSYRGKALLLESDGAELTELYYPLTLTPDTVYFASWRMRRTEFANAGELRFEIVDGISGNVISDSSGQANEYAQQAAAVPTGEHIFRFLDFRIPPGLSSPVYLRIRVSQAITAGCGIAIDDVLVQPAQQLYAGGPYLASAVGRVMVPGERWTLSVQNNRDCLWQDWYNRLFDMRTRGLLLPVSGSNLIPDSLITEEESSSSSSSTSSDSSSVSDSSSSFSSSSTSSSDSSNSSSSSTSDSSST